jgi:hypothetical protein
VYWLLRHNDNPPQQKSKGKTAEDLVDRQLPELLFHMEELRGKIILYFDIIFFAILPADCHYLLCHITEHYVGLGIVCSQPNVHSPLVYFSIGICRLLQYVVTT